MYWLSMVAVSLEPRLSVPIETDCIIHLQSSSLRESLQIHFEVTFMLLDDSFTDVSGK